MELMYIDESCHLRRDKEDTVIVGAMTVSENMKQQIVNDIRNLKVKHCIPKYSEIKWTKISGNNADFYVELIQYFKSSKEMQFKAVLQSDKEKVFKKIEEHGYREGVLYLILIGTSIIKHMRVDRKYKVFIDYKDSHGGERIETLMRSFKKEPFKSMIHSINQIDSTESEIMQLTDVLIGAIRYIETNSVNKITNPGKIKVIKECLQLNIDMIHKVIDSIGSNYNDISPLIEVEKLNLLEDF
jgi:hypothetical protein